MRSVQRFAIAAIACALAFSASGAFSLILSEPCTGYELADGGQDDDQRDGDERRQQSVLDRGGAALAFQKAIEIHLPGFPSPVQWGG